MSSDISKDGNAWERLFKLWASICKLLLDGKRDLEKVASVLQVIIDERKENPYFRKIAEGKLPATEGKRTLAKMVELFEGFLDNNFVNWGTDVPGEAKSETPFEVFELVKNGTFAQVFGAFGAGLDRLCWSQDQIITFVENHVDLLHPEGWPIFFLFKVGEEFFVAHVFRIDDGQLKAYVYQLSCGRVWDAVNRIRFVIPQ